MIIGVHRHTDDLWVAWFGDNPDHWQMGRSKHEAIGSLIAHNGKWHLIGVQEFDKVLMQVVEDTSHNASRTSQETI